MKRFLAGLLFLIGIAASANAATVGDLLVEVRRSINDQSDPRVKYTNDFLLDIMNEGHRDFVNQTWCLMTQSTQAISGSTTYYSLRNDAFAIRMVRFRNTSNIVSELTEASERSLIQSNPDYERQSGAPTQYFVRSSTKGATALEIGLVPRPNISGTLLVDYFIQAPDLTETTDVPFAGYRILYPYHHALAYYVAARVAAIEQAAESAAYYNTLYSTDVKTALDRLGRMPNYNPGFSAGSK